VKLLSKLTLFITLSKLAVVALFVFLLPSIVDSIAFKYTNYYLGEQKKKVLSIIAKNGVDYYLQGQDNYGSYTMLKEEYIALEPVTQQAHADTIETAQRIVEQDTLTYRILTHTFSSDSKNYLLEIGKTTEAINQYTSPLQRVALNVLIVLTLITMVIDLVYTRFLLRPLGRIIKTKLVNRKFPFNEHIPPVNTTTADFKYLDNSLIQLMDQIHLAFEKEREFTSNASHELMTPISILQNKMENMLIDQDISDQQQQKMADMMKTLNRLKKIVHSLLLISRIENDQFAKADNINPRSLIDEVMEELGPRLEEKEINFKTDLKDGYIEKYES
jgi:two-component system sensor histidine kinase ArlS